VFAVLPIAFSIFQLAVQAYAGQQILDEVHSIINQTLQQKAKKYWLFRVTN
jgi:hypothetical protein